MFLRSLTISGANGLIRDINFHRGVNLIVDNSEGAGESGNNVGKTTILRLIDYCLGGKGNNIFEDPEFKTTSDLKPFLEKNEVLVTLVMTENLEKSHASTITIERNFLAGAERILRIDGEQYSLKGKKSFSAELSLRIFGIEETKPTFRQIVAKNIRDEKSRLNHVLKILHPTTKAVEYEALYQFWLGVHTDEGAAYQQIRESIRRQESFRGQLAKEFDITGFSIITDLQESISILQKQKNELDLDQDYLAQLEAFDHIKSDITRAATQLSIIQLRKDLIEDSRHSLEDDISVVSTKEIRRLYEEAKILIPDIQRSFEESVEFHNNMIANKLSFITKELPNLVVQEQILRKELNELEISASQFKELFKKEKTIQVLEKINHDLQRQIERLSKLAEQQRIWTSCIEDLETLKTRSADHEERSKSLNEQIDDNLLRFNQVLKRVSQELYGEQFKLLRKELDEEGEELQFLQFALRGVTSNPGTGEKKGQITAFDLAYIEFAEEMDIPHLNFILHDQIENVDGRQIVTILEKLVPTINCQYIAPILRDKIPPEIDVNRYAVIELSKEEKLFKF